MFAHADMAGLPFYAQIQSSMDQNYLKNEIAAALHMHRFFSCHYSLHNEVPPLVAYALWWVWWM
jgi:hypothetical protein